MNGTMTATRPECSTGRIIPSAKEYRAAFAMSYEEPQRDQDLLSLKFEGELTNDEIGRDLGMTTVNVRVAIFRALKRLKALMTGDGSVMNVRPSTPDTGQRGQTLLMFTFALTMFMALFAITIDVGLAYMKDQQAQGAADAAAIAGASLLSSGGPTAAINEARVYAEKNGFASGNGATVTVVTPYNGDPAKIEVVIEQEMPLVFGQTLGKTSLTIKARAVASSPSTLNPVNYAILVTNPAACEAFRKVGAGTLIITNSGATMTNSSCGPSIKATGSGSVNSAYNHYFIGGGYDGAGQFVPAPSSVAQTVADPLAGRVRPNLSDSPTSPNSGGTATSPAKRIINGGSTTLQPGIFWGGLELAGNASVTFSPGVYIMAGGGYLDKGTGTTTGSDVTIFNTSNPNVASSIGACGEIRVTGSSQINFSGPTSGPNKDIVFWQADSCSATLRLSGGGGGRIGLVYLPKGTLRIEGKKDLTAGQIIVDRLDIADAGQLTVEAAAYVAMPIAIQPKLTE